MIVNEIYRVAQEGFNLRPHMMDGQVKKPRIVNRLGGDIKCHMKSNA